MSVISCARAAGDETSAVGAAPPTAHWERDPERATGTPEATFSLPSLLYHETASVNRSTVEVGEAVLAINAGAAASAAAVTVAPETASPSESATSVGGSGGENVTAAPAASAPSSVSSSRLRAMTREDDTAIAVAPESSRWTMDAGSPPSVHCEAETAPETRSSKVMTAPVPFV